MIAKSQNLVGESLIHILNGALNRPMRDALLLHHAIAEVGTGRDRAELLISRLVRMHWEPHHLERAKAEYKRRYGKYVEDHIVREIINKNGNGKCDWAEFCIELVKSSTQHVMDDDLTNVLFFLRYLTRSGVGFRFRCQKAPIPIYQIYTERSHASMWKGKALAT
ncbi:annexin ANXC4 [Coccidioides immitis RMSCC 3703]|uniref:Annexin ANXC4 n=1 Tax=Coccidioides immitis RMSCC 3703 TaxID=454286 RepID=A0A0J8RCR6_COCIT|nr:annexin ANXC4 [Coccidioides immitis RMSCC 3703]